MSVPRGLAHVGILAAIGAGIWIGAELFRILGGG